jgi:hypothetical protein
MGENRTHSFTSGSALILSGLSRLVRLAATTCVGLLLLGASCDGVISRPLVGRKTFLYKPASGPAEESYRIAIPDGKLEYADVAHFTPEILIDRNGRQGDIRFTIEVKERKRSRDDTIGVMELTIPDGRSQHIGLTRTLAYPSAVRGATPPVNAPFETLGTFWIGCTRKARVRGNAPKTDNARADVYLEITRVVVATERVRELEGWKTSRSRVRCTSS